ncbi:site-specific integrase [Gemmata sp. G18]|uniref:Site-specific integrase n=1 Tax=Gemmata palustris TaxID=2822762 RepID=A0ABS5BMR2_9BACT|nr:site-specific integrase [Gemmata palustris]MBP3954971.1 site-specific integrase [Gemmata palustris]
MNHTPKLCHHKGSEQGYVTLNGKEHYLGFWSRDQKKSPPAVRAEYDAVIARWLANGRRLPDAVTAAPPPVTVNKIILEFVRYAEGHYATRRKGKPSAEVKGIKDACRVLSNLFGPLPATGFGPKALKQVRAKMIEKGWSRSYCNKQANRLKRAFRWAVAEELCPASVIHALSAVPAIRKGEGGVRETGPVKPVPDEWIEATVPFLSRQVAALVRFQIHTGARPGEAVLIRGRDIDRTGRVWVYKPEHHKTEHKGRTREIYIGPKAQAVLLPWLRDDPDTYLFSPKEAEGDRNSERTETRKTHRWPSHMRANAKKRKANPKRPKGDCYTADSYRMAIEYARRKADQKGRMAAVERAKSESPAADVSAFNEVVFLPSWSPHRLRHNAATAMRKEFGVEMARLALGHKHGFTTEIYAERDLVKILEAVERIG